MRARAARARRAAAAAMALNMTEGMNMEKTVSKNTVEARTVFKQCQAVNRILRSTLLRHLILYILKP